MNLENKLTSYFSGVGSEIINIGSLALPLDFKDSSGATFNAMVDLYSPGGPGTYIEIKEHPLNYMKTIEDSRNRLFKDASFKRLFTADEMEEWDQNKISREIWNCGGKGRTTCLKYAWNHSIFKQQIVSNEIKKTGGSFQIWFKHNVQLSKQQTNLLDKFEIEFKILPAPSYFDEFDFKGLLN